MKKSFLVGSTIKISMLTLSSCSFIVPKPCFEMSCESLRQFDQILMGEEVFFNNCSNDGLSYAWDFGDGTTSSVYGPRHTWEEAGQYTVSLTISNEKNSKTITKDVTVENSVYGTWDGTFTDGSSKFAFSMSLEQSATKIKGSFNYAPYNRSGILGTSCRIEDDQVSFGCVITYTFRNRTISTLFLFDGTINEELNSMQGTSITVGDNKFDSWEATKR